MKRLVRSLLLAGALVAAANPAVLSAQAPATAQLPSTEAQAFLGDWAVSIDADGMVFNLDLKLRDENGTLAGEVGSDFGSSRIPRFSRTGESLVLGYSVDMNGEGFPIVLTMTPTAEGADVQVEAGDGAFLSRGKGTRK